MALLTDLEHYYKLESDGTDSHASTDLTVNNSPSFVTGKIGKAVDLNGSNQDLTGTMSTEFDGSFTISMWINLDNVTADMRFMQSYVSSYGNYWWLIFLQGTANDRIGFSLYNGTQNPTILAAADSADAMVGNWVHVVAVRDTVADEIRCYQNNVAINTAVTDTTTSVPTYSGIALGSGNSSTEFTNGQIDEVGIWSRALTTDEISDLYNSGDGLAYPFSTGINMQVNISDVWKEGSAAKINIGDSWKVVAGIQQNIGDSWKTVF